MKKFEITEERIKLLAENNSWSESKLKEWFPNAFKKVLEYGRWIKDDANPKWMTYFKNQNERHGIDSLGYWYEMRGYLNPNNDKNNRYATPQEVQKALINEAKKRGFVEGAKFINFNGVIQTVKYIDFYNNNSLHVLSPENEWSSNCGNKNFNSNPRIFKDGVWATIIEQKEYTMQEIADALKVNVNDLKIKK
jgi:hypothetical protein